MNNLKIFIQRLDEVSLEENLILIVCFIIYPFVSPIVAENVGLPRKHALFCIVLFTFCVVCVCVCVCVCACV